MEIMLTKRDLANITFDEEKGFCCDTFYFDSILNFDDEYLPIERSIKTTESIIITWTLASGWIVIPLDNGELHYIRYSTLDDYLANTFDTDIQQQRQLSQKEELINEYIDIIKTRIDTIKAYKMRSRFVSPLELMTILVEHRQPNLKNLDLLLLLLENELHSWYKAKRKYIEYGTFDCSAFTPSLQVKKLS